MRKTILLAVFMASILPGQPAQRVNDTVLKNAAKSGDEWLTYGQTPGETRYSPLKQIDATNVAGLDWLGPTTWDRAAVTRKGRRWNGMARSMGSRTGASCSRSMRAPAKRSGDGIRR